jgi:hypothetical protein
LPAAGEIVGNYFDATDRHGFLEEADRLTRIDVPFPGAFNTAVAGINDAGHTNDWKKPCPPPSVTPFFPLASQDLP